MPLYNDNEATFIANLAEECLILEINTFPKPGLVSNIDNGSHSDMDANTFYQSAAAIKPFFAQMMLAGKENCSMPTLREIGLKAEREMMLTTGGINTHRGAIFGLGLLCAAVGLSRTTEAYTSCSLGHIVANRWGNEILPSRLNTALETTHGAIVARQYGAGGAQAEAFHGFPCVYDIGLPALQLGYHLAPNDAHAARIQACFALIANVEDTNLLHRGGLEGLQFAQNHAQKFLKMGGVGRENWLNEAQKIHTEFVNRNLSPGGCADLLSMTLFVDTAESHIPPYSTNTK